jgi:predicted TIM-barrel enzyme
MPVDRSHLRGESPKRARPARVATGSSYEIGLARDLTQTESINSVGTWILCPWLEHFPKDTGVWLSVLAAHDANERLLQALPVAKKTWPMVYAAVFAVDTLRPRAQLIRRLKSAGIAGVINFPSISFIDGEAGGVFTALSLGVDREIDFLQACSSEGLRIAGVTKSTEVAQRLIKMGVDFLIAHGGPPTRNNADPSLDVAIRVEGVAQPHNVRVIPISRLIHCSPVHLPKDRAAFYPGMHHDPPS